MLFGAGLCHNLSAPGRIPPPVRSGGVLLRSAPMALYTVKLLCVDAAEHDKFYVMRVEEDSGGGGLSL